MKENPPNDGNLFFMVLLLLTLLGFLLYERITGKDPWKRVEDTATFETERLKFSRDDFN